MIRPTTPVANRVNARELAAARATRAAEISRRAAAARRRLTLAVILVVATVAVVTAAAVGPLAWGWSLIPAAALGGVLYTGRQAAVAAARQDARARAEMARLDERLRLFRDREADSEPVAVRAGSFEEILVGYEGRHRAPAALDDEPPRHATTASLEALAAERSAGAPVDAAPVKTQRPPAATTWTPVPVPLPTYTLKQESPRRDVEPFTPAEHAGHDVRVPVRPQATAPSHGTLSAGTVEGEPEARTFDLDSVLARRRAAGA